MEGMYDIHCHIIPGVDDGAEDLDMAMELLRMEYSDGVRTIILTPHFRRRMFEPPMEQVTASYKQLKEAAADELDMKLYLGCEYHVNMDIAEDFIKGRRPTMAGSRYVLCEYSSASEPAFIKERSYHLISRGFVPILAHIERYPALTKNFDLIEELTEMGCMMQMNAGSILGADGFKVKRFCKKVIQYDMLHLIGSDAHDLKLRVPRMGACAAYLEKKYGRAYAEKILCENPAHIIAEQDLR